MRAHVKRMRNAGRNITLCHDDGAQTSREHAHEDLQDGTDGWYGTTTPLVRSSVWIHPTGSDHSSSLPPPPTHPHHHHPSIPPPPRQRRYDRYSELMCSKWDMEAGVTWTIISFNQPPKQNPTHRAWWPQHTTVYLKVRSYQPTHPHRAWWPQHTATC